MSINIIQQAAFLGESKADPGIVEWKSFLLFYQSRLFASSSGSLCHIQDTTSILRHFKMIFMVRVALPVIDLTGTLYAINLHWRSKATFCVCDLDSVLTNWIAVDVRAKGFLLLTSLPGVLHHPMEGFPLAATTIVPKHLEVTTTLNLT